MTKSGKDDTIIPSIDQYKELHKRYSFGSDKDEIVTLKRSNIVHDFAEVKSSESERIVRKEELCDTKHENLFLKFKEYINNEFINQLKYTFKDDFSKLYKLIYYLIYFLLIIAIISFIWLNHTLLTWTWLQNHPKYLLIKLILSIFFIIFLLIIPNKKNWKVWISLSIATLLIPLLFKIL